ncbi:choice-of-anchor G family protein [Herbiconiux sp. CPCC 203407]|uniref:Choice-of-anchor G family protein n=1 Tax=Herbiconiux oxytropis TaxID=2970915 RepID=A0AA42BT20_9MICO|nr:choice-of-anchor G family protein [Herbiconiux oxytropis]MCS5722680.1 choice-of-anchor G family protein [Herbiconiux oxytropis]MCS5725377.1 choice-of-anchor G family protein [Herbiconiux oxytropis]
MRRLTTTIGLLSTAALTVALVPSTIAATTASWPDEEWVNGTVGTSSFDCGTDTGYASTAFGRFLSGSLLGQDLDPLAEVEGVELFRAADGALTVDPPSAIQQPPLPETDTYTNPLDIDLLGGLVGLDLTGLTVGLPLGSAGALNQYAQVSGYGTGAGASGLVTNSGGVGVTPTTPDNELPEPATIALSNFIPAVAGVADVELEVGAVAASSELDWCAVLANELWGVGPVTGSVREYGIASLDLSAESDLLDDLVTEVNETVPVIQTAVDDLAGPDGLISDEVLDGLVGNLLTGLGVGDLEGDVILDVDLQGAVADRLATPLTDAEGIVTIDLGGGTIDVDLAALLGTPGTGLNSLAPNTELVLNDEVVNELVAIIGGLLDDFTTGITSDLTEALYEAQLTVDLDTSVTLLAGAVPLVDVSIFLQSTLGALLAPEPGAPPVVFTVETTILPILPAVQFALSLLGIDLDEIVDVVVEPLVTELVGPLVALLNGNVISLVTTLGEDLALLTAPIVTALSGLLGFLPDTIASIEVNAQPDQPGGDGPYIPADPATQSSAQYLVTALELELIPLVAPGGLTELRFATASVGPITAP